SPPATSRRRSRRARRARTPASPAGWPSPPAREPLEQTLVSHYAPVILGEGPPLTESLDALIKQGEGRQDAVAVGDGIFMSKGIANSYLVTTPEGDLLINTGLHTEAPEIKARFGRVSDSPLRAIVFTQGHPDH